jgi:DNA-directed RNA polymerase specialized sigma24 family protein
MTESLISQAEIKELDNYLKGYALNVKLLRLDKYERTYFGYKDGDDSAFNDAPLARAKMFEVRHFIMGMKNSDEKLLLYYHYIRGESVERCAELMGISRRSAFRIKKRALEHVAEQKFKNVKISV